MDIACTVRRSFPGPGGIARMLHVVSAELAQRHTVRVWAARIDEAPFTRLNTTLGAQRFEPVSLDGVEVRPLPSGSLERAAAVPLALQTVPVLRRFAFRPLRALTAPGYVAAMARALARAWGTPDLVHCWGGEHLNWAAGAAAERAGVGYLVTPFAHPGAWGDDERNAAFYRRAAAVLALLPSEARAYERLGVKPERVHVVGVPVTPLPEGGPDVRARLGLGDAPLVLFLGVKQPYKGYRLLLEAAPLVWREVPGARFAFVGPRTPGSDADFRGADRRVVEVGLVPDDEVAAWLRAATAFCLPSTSEIMPVAILEAWQAGKPVVAAEWWCARDLIEHERDGLLVEPQAASLARALVSLLKDRDGARALGDAGRAKILGGYSPQTVAERHEAAYRAAMRAGRS